MLQLLGFQSQELIMPSVWSSLPSSAAIALQKSQESWSLVWDQRLVSCGLDLLEGIDYIH